MDKLAETLIQHVDEESAQRVHWSHPGLQSAAKLWAAHALDTYVDGLLDKALAVSKALADFAHEL